MSAVIENISVDCANPYLLAQFWSQVLDRPVHPDDKPADDEVGVVLGEGRELLFQRVPEPKSVKNRLHLCLRPDQPREREVERLESIGAALVHDRRNADGTGWAVLADPEGNEFCVLRSADEKISGSPTPDWFPHSQSPAYAGAHTAPHLLVFPRRSKRRARRDAHGSRPQIDAERAGRRQAAASRR